MRKKKVNRIDYLIENLASEFGKIPNFSLTQSDPDANRVFNFIVFKTSEIQDFKTLFLKYYIPATNRAIIDSKKAIAKSIYKKLLQVNHEQIQENHYETIRLGYVGLFHKIENFQKDYVKEIEVAFNDNKGDLRDFIKNKFNYDIHKNWHWDPVVRKINWINNMVKHNNGFSDNNIPSLLYNLKPNERIRISRESFTHDLNYISDKYLDIIIKLFLILGSYKYFHNEYIENESNLLDEVMPDLNKKLLELEKMIISMTRNIS